MPVIVGTNANNILVGTGLRDRIFGLLGQDTLTGLEGDDILSGQGGADSLDGGLGDDILDGGSGFDLLMGGEGSDILDAGGGRDQLFGGLGDDLLDGGFDKAQDQLFGDDGDDDVLVRWNDVALGGAGTDILVIDDIVKVPDPIAIDLSGIGGGDAVSIGYNGIAAGQFEGADVYLEGDLGPTSIIGTAGDDRIAVESCGCGGGATINGGRGDDDLSGSYGADRILGGVGDDLIFGSLGPDRLLGGAGSDLFSIDLTLLIVPSEASVIVDFRPEDFLLVQQTFPIAEVDLSNPLVAGPDPVADSDLAQFLYDTQTGYLSFDPDGIGSAEGIHVFTLMGKPLLAAAQLILDL